MARFQFQLEPLLKYRVHRRDALRSAYGQILAEQNALEAQIDKLKRSRGEQLDEMRERTAGGAVDVDGTAARRFHAGRISLDELGLQRELLQAAERAVQCRDLLVQADQDVKALEKLKAKRQGEFEYGENRRTQLELEDVWLSAHAGDFAP